MARLGDLKTWADVRRFFTEAEVRRLEPNDREEFENLQALKRFRMKASFDAPGYDLERRSIQSVAVDWFERERNYLEARSHLVEENEKRLMMGFRTACVALLGPGWEDETDFLQRERDYAEAYQHGMDLSFGEKPNPFLKKELVTPELPPVVHRTLVRHWTNPDFPLWLMTNRALSQSIRYLNGFGDLIEGSVNTTLKRLGLERLQHRPIQEVNFSRDKRRRFAAFKVASYLSEELDSVLPVTKGREESRSTHLDGRHFLCEDRFPALPVRRSARATDQRPK